MAIAVRLTDAQPEYDRESEQRFRRELETILLVFASRVESISNGANTEASLHSRTRSFIFEDLTQETIT